MYQNVMVLNIKIIITLTEKYAVVSHKKLLSCNKFYLHCYGHLQDQVKEETLVC